MKSSVNAFPFYSKIEMQNRFKENSSKNCSYKLLCPKDAFLPFQITVKGDVKIVSFYICESEFNKRKLHRFDSTLEVEWIEDYTHTVFTYYGDKIVSEGQNIIMDAVPKWIEIELDNGKSIYSEVFYPQDFKVNEVNQFLRIEYFNTSDLDPIIYHNNFKQVFFLDSFIHTNEPEIEEEVKENNSGRVIPLKSRMITNYLISDIVPDFLKLAITSLQLHDNIKIIDSYNRQEITADRVVTTSTLSSDGAFSNIEIRVRQILLTLNACNSEII